MRMDRERGGGPVVTGLSPRGFKVRASDFEGVYAALTITPETVAEWTPPPLEALDIAAIAPLLALSPVPEFLLLGTGPTLRRPPPAFVAAVEAAGSGVEAMDSRAAARAWAVLRGEDRWVAGAFYPL